MDFTGYIKDIKMPSEHEINIELSTKNRTILESIQKLFNKKKELSISIKAKSQKRSLDANAYSWLLMEKIGEVINKSKDEVYIDMLGRYGVFTHVIVKPQVVERMKEEWRLVRELEELKNNGYSIEEIMYKISNISTKLRREKYRILESKVYNVDDKFPQIINNSFKENKLPEGISKIEYIVDLSDLKNNEIDLNF